MRIVRTLSLAIALISCTAVYAHTDFTFADIPWKSSPKIVKDLMAAQGYDFVQDHEERDEIYAGQVSGEPAIVICYYTRDRELVKVAVALDNAELDAIAKYRKLKDQLASHFGTPSLDAEEYELPYRAGDGHEEIALRQGQGVIAALWTLEDGVTPLTIQITRTLTVAVQYNSDAWHDEELLRGVARAGHS